MVHKYQFLWPFMTIVLNTQPQCVKSCLVVTKTLYKTNFNTFTVIAWDAWLTKKFVNT